MVGLVVKVEGAESVLTDNQSLATEQDLVLGSEISSSMAISPWKHSGGLKEAAIEKQHNCGMDRATPGCLFSGSRWGTLHSP